MVRKTSKRVRFLKKKKICYSNWSGVEQNYRAFYQCHVKIEALGPSHVQSPSNDYKITTKIFPRFWGHCAHQKFNNLVPNHRENFQLLEKLLKINCFYLHSPLGQDKSKSCRKVVFFYGFCFLNGFWFVFQNMDLLIKTADKRDLKMLKTGIPDIGDTVCKKLIRKGFCLCNFLNLLEVVWKFPNSRTCILVQLKKSVGVAGKNIKWPRNKTTLSNVVNAGDHHDSYLRTHVFVALITFSE